MSWTPYAIPTAVALLLSLIILIYVITLGLDRRVNRLFFMLVSCAGLWELTHLFELLQTHLQTRLIWVYIQYVPINFIPLLYFSLAAAMTGRNSLLRRAVIIPILGFSLAMTLAIWLDPIHHLFYVEGSAGMERLAEGGYTFTFDEGPLFWTQVAFSYILLFGGFLQYGVVLFREGSSMLRKQSAILLGATLIPLAGNVIYIFSPIEQLPRVDLTPLLISITMFFFAIAIRYYKFLSISPPVTSQVLSQMTDALLYFDERGRLADLNPAAEALVGQDRLDLLGGHLGDVFSLTGPVRVSPEASSRLDEDLHAILNATIGTSRFDVDLDTAGPDVKSLQISLFPLKLEGDPRPIGVALQCEDVSERKTAARQREALLAISMLINASTDVVSLCNASVELIGEILDMPIVGIWLHQPRNKVIRLTSCVGFIQDLEKKIGVQSLEPGGPGVAAETARRREMIVIDDAANHPLLAYAASEVMRNQSRSIISAPLVAGGELIGVLQVVNRRPKSLSDQDTQTISLVSSQLAMGINRIRLLEEYTQASLSLEEETKRSAEAGGLKERFLSNMSHAMRTPMNSILGFSKILLRGHYGPLPEEMVEPIEIIHRSGEGLMRVISEVMQISRIEAGKLHPRPELAHADDMARAVCAELSNIAEQHDVDLVSEVEEGCLVWADPELLADALRHLAETALALSRDGPVTISAGGDNDRTLFRVSYGGESIPTQYHHQVFEKFAQIENADLKNYVGSGLNLSIAKALVELHGGRMWIESGEAGPSFVFELPRVSSEPDRKQ